MSEQVFEFSEPAEMAARWLRQMLDREASRRGLPIREAARWLGGRIKLSPAAILRIVYERPADVGTRVYRAINLERIIEIEHDISALRHELALAMAGQIDRTADEVAEIEAEFESLRAKVKALKGGL